MFILFLISKRTTSHFTGLLEIFIGNIKKKKSNHENKYGYLAYCNSMQMIFDTHSKPLQIFISKNVSFQPNSSYLLNLLGVL